MTVSALDKMSLDRRAMARMADRIGSAADELRDRLRSQTPPDPKLAEAASRLDDYAKAMRDDPLTAIRADPPKILADLL